MIANDNIFFDSKALAGAAGTDVSTTIKVGAKAGNGGDAKLDFRMIEAAAGGTNVNLQIFTGNAPDMSDETLLMETGVIDETKLKLGYCYPLEALPTGSTKIYVRAKLVKTGTHTAGKIFGAIVANKQCN